MVRILNSAERKILASILNQTPPIFWEELQLNKSQQKIFAQKLSQLEAGQPLDYVIGQTEVGGLKLKITPDVLIPRPETVEWLEFLQNEFRNNHTVLDIGTGSGLIGLWVAKLVKQVILTDVCPLALRIAKHNAQLNQIFNIEFFKSDLLQNPDLTKRLLTTKNLILLANLPYLPDSDRPLKGLHNISYEPDLALFSGSDGLDLFRRLLLELSDLQFQPECLVFELDPRNIRLASELVFKQLRWATYCDLQIWSDSNGLDRCLIFRNHQAG